MAEPVVSQLPKCIECGQSWLAQDDSRWRLYLGGEDVIDPGEVFFYCPDCAEREFGDA